MLTHTAVDELTSSLKSHLWPKKQFLQHTENHKIKPQRICHWVNDWKVSVSEGSLVLLLGKKKFRDFPDRKNSYSGDCKNLCISSAPVNLNCTLHWAATPGATKLSRKLQFHSWPLEGGSKTESVPTHRRLLHCSTLQLGTKKVLVSMETGIILQLILFAVWFSPPKMQRQTDIGWFQLCSPLTQLRFSHRFFPVCFFDTTEWKKLPVRFLNSKLNSKPEHPSESDF